jgi:two-component system sensor histidine kinase ChiS
MTYRILIVDDNETNLLLISKILSLEGYQVMTAVSGTEALALVGENVPDLAILDVMMPEMDGFELCRKLREPPDQERFPIVMLTATNNVCDRRLALEAGAVKVWQKPFDIDTLRIEIKTLLKDNGHPA